MRRAARKLFQLEIHYPKRKLSPAVYGSTHQTSSALDAATSTRPVPISRYCVVLWTHTFIYVYLWYFRHFNSCRDVLAHACSSISFPHTWSWVSTSPFPHFQCDNVIKSVNPRYGPGFWWEHLNKVFSASSL